MVEDYFEVNSQDIPNNELDSNHNTILVSEYYPATFSVPPSLEIELRNKIAELETKIDTLRISESIPSPSLPSLPSSSEKEMQIEINKLSLKIEKIGKYVINSIQEVKDSRNNSDKKVLGSLNKAETVVRMEGIRAGLAAATPQEKKQMLGERLFLPIQKIDPRAAKITGMMLEEDNEKILKMIEDPDYLAKKVKAAVDKLK